MVYVTPPAPQQQDDDLPKRSVGRPLSRHNVYEVTGCHKVTKRIRANSQDEAQELFLGKSSLSYYNGGIEIKEKRMSVK